MTRKEHFTPQEWDTLMEATALAGVGLINTDKASMLEVVREMVALASSLVQAETQYKGNELLQQIIRELRTDPQKTYQRLQRQAIDTGEVEGVVKYLELAANILRRRAHDTDFATYKHFLISLLQRVAHASGEGRLGFLSSSVSRAEADYLLRVEAVFE